MVQNHGSGVIYHNKFKNENAKVVFLNLQTGGLSTKSDVLQIGLKCGKKSFNHYVKPSKPIPSGATRIHGLHNDGRTLYKNGVEVEALSLHRAVKDMLNFLDDLEGPCILVAHQANFHVQKLKRIIRICRSYYIFDDIVDGYVDTLSMFKKKFPTRKEEGQLTLEALVKFILPLPLPKQKDAFYYTLLLQQLVYRCFEYPQLMENLKDLKTKEKLVIF